MANDIFNTLRLQGKQEDIDKVVKFLIKDERVVAFDVLAKGARYAYDAKYVAEHNAFTYRTDWEPEFIALALLAEMYPNVEFHLDWWTEDDYWEFKHSWDVPKYGDLKDHYLFSYLFNKKEEKNEDNEEEVVEQDDNSDMPF